jgi:hypothetical protein
MSSFFVGGPAGAACVCSDCGAVWHIDDMQIIHSADERLFAGEEVPAGECPDEECGALCYVEKDSDGQLVMWDALPDDKKERSFRCT